MSLLDDLYAHQAWADAAHFGAIAAQPAARTDPAIVQRLHHIYTVQRFFLWMTRDRAQEFVLPPADTAAFHRLQPLVRAYHDKIRPFVESLPSSRLDEPLDHPFAPPDSGVVTIGQALMQCAMHSHYHRGQNATRLRELGGEPPITDLIAWYMFGRKEPVWDPA